jgi:hypothetical protein
MGICDGPRRQKSWKEGVMKCSNPECNRGIGLVAAVADRQAASDDHNRRETALYAQSLEWKALARN